MGMVEATVSLVALAESANTRSVRGVVMLILDDTVEGLHKYVITLKQIHQKLLQQL